jgi:2-aminoethylphosphonate-pyruvate transaminase
MNSPSVAVILAAGLGVRMGEAGLLRPKGFIEIGAMPLIERSILRLRESGIRRVIIVTGHLAEHYESLHSRHSDFLKLVHNDRYSDYGSMYSLFVGGSVAEYPFLLLESDLIYERRALAILSNDEASDAVLLSGKTGAGDEYYIEANEGLLVNASKDRRAFSKPPLGEWTGISKLSEACFTEMVLFGESSVQGRFRMGYEDALVAAAQKIPVHCRLVEDLLWSEVDDEGQLVHAQSRVYPRIAAIDGSDHGS